MIEEGYVKLDCFLIWDDQEIWVDITDYVNRFKLGEQGK